MTIRVLQYLIEMTLLALCSLVEMTIRVLQYLIEMTLLALCALVEMTGCAAIGLGEEGEAEALGRLDGTEGGAGRDVGKEAGFGDPDDRIGERNGRLNGIELLQGIEAAVDQRRVHQRTGGIMEEEGSIMERNG